MDPSAVPPHHVSESLERLERRLGELSTSMGAVERAVGHATGGAAPAWRRVTGAEQRPWRNPTSRGSDCGQPAPGRSRRQLTPDSR